MKASKLIVAAAVLLATALNSMGQTTLAGSIIVYPQLSYVKTSGVATITAAFPASILNWTVTNGTNAYQMNALFNEGPIATSNGTIRTVIPVTCTNAFGDALAFKRIAWLAILSATNNAGDIVVTVGTNGPAFVTGSTTIKPGGMVIYTAPDLAGYPVGIGSSVTVSNATGTNALHQLYLGGVI